MIRSYNSNNNQQQGLCFVIVISIVIFLGFGYFSIFYYPTKHYSECTRTFSYLIDNSELNYNQNQSTKNSAEPTKNQTNQTNVTNIIQNETITQNNSLNFNETFNQNQNNISNNISNVTQNVSNIQNQTLSNKSNETLKILEIFDITFPQYNKSSYEVSTPIFGETDLFFQKRFQLPPSDAEIIQGMTFVDDRYCPNVTFGSEEALYSLKQIYSAGIDWVAIVVTEYQNNTSTNEIFPVFDKIYLQYYTHITATLSNLTFIINAAHQIGLRVMLKPHIDLLSDRNGPWRGNIHTADPDLWFEFYSTMMNKYATVAQSLNVEMLSLECELIGMSSFTKKWQQLISEIRQIYHGKMISSTNYGGEEVGTGYWNELDYIGVDAYYLNWVQLDNINVEEIIKKWSGPFQTMKQLSDKYNKSVIITEIGFCSGTCLRGSKNQPVHHECQAKNYEALLKLLELNTSWLKGIFFWSWNTDPSFGGNEDICISPQYKIAEEKMRQYWKGREKLEKPSFDQKCLCTL